MTTAAADLHVHSRFSDRPSEWLLARVRAAESYTDPLVVYRRCRERGMTLVTLTDHDTIDGALEIAHLAGVFLSCEVTARFPEDHCPIHCLVFGIDENQHREIQRLRDNVYELRDYVYDHGIAHSVAHPLFRVGDQFSLEHFEKLLVLFKCFEGLNGAHDARLSMVTRAVLNNLTPRQVDDFANRHDIDPRDPEPWRKHLTAGSDDHCGLYVASAWSSVQAEGPISASRFLHELRAGELSIEGAAGSSLKLGRGLHRIAARFARTRPAGDDGALQLLAWMFDGIARAGMTAGEEVEPATTCAAPGGRTGLPSFVGAVVRDEIAAKGAGATPEDSSFRLASSIGQRLMIEGAWRGVAAIRDGELTGALDAWRSLFPAALAVAPYVVAWRSHHKDEGLVREVADRFPAARLLRERSGRTAWFRDSPGAGAPPVDDVSVDLAIELAGGEDRLRVLQLAQGAIPSGGLALGRDVFQPLCDLGLFATAPSLPVPPLLDLLHHCERGRFDRVLISSLGPMAAAARCAASCLELELIAIFTSRSYEQLSIAIGDLVPEGALASWVRWLYRPAREVLALDELARGLLEQLGMAHRVRVVEAGVLEAAQAL